MLGREGELGIQWMPGGSTNYKFVRRERKRDGGMDGGRVGRRERNVLPQ